METRRMKIFAIKKWWSNLILILLEFLPVVRFAKISIREQGLVHELKA